MDRKLKTFRIAACVARKNLDVAYEEMARDEAREAQALEWVEATVGDVPDEIAT